MEVADVYKLIIHLSYLLLSLAARFPILYLDVITGCFQIRPRFYCWSCVWLLSLFAFGFDSFVNRASRLPVCSCFIHASLRLARSTRSDSLILSKNRVQYKKQPTTHLAKRTKTTITQSRIMAEVMPRRSHELFDSIGPDDFETASIRSAAPSYREFSAMPPMPPRSSTSLVQTTPAVTNRFIRTRFRSTHITLHRPQHARQQPLAAVHRSSGGLR